VSRVAANFFAGFHGIGPLTEAVHNFFDAVRFGHGDVASFAKAVGDSGATAVLTADDYDQLASTLAKTENNANTLAAAMANKLFTETMNLDQATLSWYSSLTSLGEQLAKNNHIIDIHTKKGEEDRAAVLAAVQANMAQYQAFVAVGGSATDAARQYDQNTQALERQLRKAGLTSAEIDNLIGKYKGIPDTVNTTIATNGLTQAINDLADLIAKINGINNKKYTYTIDGNITYHYTGTDFYHGFGASGGRISGYAAGGFAEGFAKGGRVIKVGEMGPEYLTFGNDAGPMYVTPNSAINGQANSTRQAPQQVEWRVTGDGGLRTLIQAAVRGGDIQLFVDGKPVTVNP
jgi:putative intracellular protease/amidase